jgi:hypothetical protein
MCFKPVNCYVRISLLILLGIVVLSEGIAEPPWADLERPEHDYWNRPLTDDFSRLKEKLEAGELPLNYSSEKAFLVSLLGALKIPVSSQTMVYSTTSLQLRLINIRNPRTLYFNEDLYIGFIPGGRIEVIALNPELGGIFYIFDIPKGKRTVRVERSTRCMNCHANEDTGHVPGLLAKSVIPGSNGGSLRAFRIEQSGHSIPLSDRFGGWHVTGADSLKEHHGNRTGAFVGGKLVTYPVRPGTRFSWQRYPAKTSDILAHLILEHQIGFVNRVLEAGYRTRAYLREDGGSLSTEHETDLSGQADLLTRYVLFADEAKLPEGGFEGDSAFKSDFLKQGRNAEAGISLREFDLSTRIFKYRCSYMIQSSVFRGLPTEMKVRVFRRLQRALGGEDKNFSYLESAERAAILDLLRKRVRGFASVSS